MAAESRRVEGRNFAPPRREEIAPEELGVYDEAVERIAKFSHSDPSTGWLPSGYYGTVLNSPPWAAAISQFAFAARDAGNREGTYSHADREWIDQVMAYHLKYYGVLEGHTPDGIAVGVRLEAIEALHEGTDEPLTDDELLLATYIRQVTDGTVTDETWNAMLERMGLRGLIEYTMFICHLQRVFRMQQAFGRDAITYEQVGEMLRAIRAGTFELPDYRTAQRVGS